MLITSLWSVLERNVGVESIADFKRSFTEVMFASIDSVAGALPSMSADEARAFITFFFVAGLWPAANPAPVVVEVLEREEFAGLCIAFEAELRAYARPVLRGLPSGQA